LFIVQEVVYTNYTFRIFINLYLSIFYTLQLHCKPFINVYVLINKFNTTHKLHAIYDQFNYLNDKHFPKQRSMIGLSTVSS